MTNEESKLWYEFLKDLPVTVTRQKILGNYIVDFYIAECKIVIELDGSQHYEDEGLKRDKIRDEFLGSLGIKVLRYTNLLVNTRFKEVCADIYHHIYPNE